MSWVIASLLMFTSSVVLYLAIRSSNYQNTPTELNNLSMYLLPLLMFFLIILVTGTSLFITWHQFLIILLLAIFFSYLGNYASLKSVELAPNPGFSLVISKSYVVFTSIVAIFAFNQSLTIRATAGILIILLSSALISIGKSKTSSNHSKKWLVLAFISFFCFGLLSLTSKYLLVLGVEIVVRLFYSMAIVTLIIFIDLIKKNIGIKNTSSSQLKTLILIGVSAAAFNYCMQVALDTAPNIGYVNAINAASIGAITVLSKFIFNDELNLKKFVGVIGVIVGLILLVI